MRSTRLLHELLTLLSFAIMLAGCADVSCPLNSKVVSTWNFYNADQEPVSLLDSLYVIAHVPGKDTVLVNRLYDAEGFSIPLSYHNSSDNYILEIHMPDTIWNPSYLPEGKELKEKNGIQYYTDVRIVRESITLTKTDNNYFDSPSCGVRVYHDINDVTCQNVFLDSIIIQNPKVDNNEQENLRLYFK